MEIATIGSQPLQYFQLTTTYSISASIFILPIKTTIDLCKQPL
jgi:hypothetical protein